MTRPVFVLAGNGAVIATNEVGDALLIDKGRRLRRDPELPPPKWAVMRDGWS